MWVGGSVGKLNGCLWTCLFCLTCAPPVLCRDLYNNQLTGKVPNSIGNLNQLTSLYVVVMVS